MFSEEYERDLLLLKLTVENPFISKWVIVENSYTFQGQRKNKYLDQIINEKEFDKFRDKIHLISLDKNFHLDYEPSLFLVVKRRVKRWLNQFLGRKYELIPYSEFAAFHCEIEQRYAAERYIAENFDNDDIVFPGDTDEIWDLNDGKYKSFVEIVNKHRKPIHFFRKVFCYDFDNYSNRERYAPVIRVRDILKRKYAFHYYKHQGEKNIFTSTQIYFFEYTYCFSKPAMIRKLRTFAHVTDLDDSALEFSLRHNISLTTPDNANITFFNNEENICTREVLTEFNSPLYVREHFNYLSTNLIPENYLENRENLIKKIKE